MPNPHSRILSFPMNKAEYISALYSTLASMGHEAATQGQYSKVFPPQVEEKLMHLRVVMDWLNDGSFGFDRIEINDEGRVTIVPKSPEPDQQLNEVNSWLKSRTEDIKASPYHKLPIRKED